MDVVVVTYRSAGTIAACLASVPPAMAASVTVVENASGDDAPRIAGEAGALVVRNPDNRGFARAANQGARLGHADLILFLNPDAAPAPDAWDALVAPFTDPTVGIVGARLVHPDGTAQRSLWPYPSPTAMWREAFGLDRLRPHDPVDCFVVGACFVVRRRVFEALGGFDEGYWLYGEESDLCYRARAHGWRTVLADDARCEHIGGASDSEGSPLVREHFLRGGERFVLKHHGPAALVSYRIAGLVATLLRLPALALVGRDDRRLGQRRVQARRTARSLLRHPFSVANDRPAKGRELVVLSLEAWDTTWRRNQFVVRELLRRWPDLRVLFVEPPRDVLHDLRRGVVGGRVKPLTAADGDGRVLRVQPRKWAPRALWPWVDRSLAGQVRRAAAEAGFDEPVLWINDSTYAPLVTAVGWRAVYDITDDWLEADTSPRERRRRIRRERALLAKADDVVVCSEELQRRRGAVRPVHLVPNAVDVDHFRAPQPRPGDLPPGRCAVYVGTLHEDRLDVDLVVRTATELADVAIVLVGPDCLGDDSRARLLARPNVHLLGARPYPSVPGYLQHADVVVVPHVVSPFTESLDPIKAYEVLAVGRPTLATPVAGFRGLEGVRVAGRATFVDELRAMLVAPRRARTAADVPSWTTRAEAFAAVLEGTATLPAPVRSLRVVYLGHCAQLSGGELALARLLPALDGVDAHVLLAEDGPLVDRLRASGVSVEVLPMADRARRLSRGAVTPQRLPLGAALDSARYVGLVARRLRELRPDVVHTNTLKAAVYGSLAARLAGVPVIMHVRDRIADDYLPTPAVLAVRALARLVPNAIIANSRATLATLGRTGRSTAVVPSPVVLHDPVVQTAMEAAPGPLVIGMVGRLAPWKGQDVFLRAVATAFPARDVRVLIVGGALFGEDEYARELEALAAELGLAEQVEFTGHVDDVSPQLRRMSIVVHASVIPEPFGQVVVEAMAASRPVVASRAGGPVEVIDEGVDGLLVPPGDSDALAAALRRLADDPAERASLGAAAAAKAESFRPERLAPDVLRLYRRLATAAR